MTATIGAVRSQGVAPVVAALVAGLALASSHALACGPDDAAIARAAIDAACPCAEATSHGAYAACAARAARAAVADPRCVREVMRCASRSTCGRPGVAICCRTRVDGSTRPTRVADPARCVAPRNGSACVSPDPMPCSACVAGGCATTTTTTTTTSTTLYTGVCGNGVIEPGTPAEPHEQCDGQAICGAADCLVHAGASCELGGGYCFGGDEALGFETYWNVGKPCYIIGGQGRPGVCTPNPDPTSCPPPPPGITLPPFIVCGTIVDRPLPATTLCCQHEAGGCFDQSVSSDSQAQGFACSLVPFGTDLLVIGTCGGDGRCVPAS